MTERPGPESVRTAGPAVGPPDGDGVPASPAGGLLDDRDLLALLASDLETGLRCALEQRFPSIRGLLRSEFGGRLDPEIDDAINHSACRLAEKFGEFDPTLGTLRAWLYRIAKHRVLDQIRQQRGLEAWPDDSLERIAAPANPGIQPGSEPPEHPENAGPDQRLRADLEALIDALPRLQRAVLRADLRAGGTADTNDLAGDLGSTPNAVYVARHRARKKLSRQLREQGHGR